MNSREKDNLIFIVFNTGEDFFSSLIKICIKYRLENGIILSGIGQMKKFKLGFMMIHQVI
jgi:predicted DNA-binding protein with PD1-like motif